MCCCLGEDDKNSNVKELTLEIEEGFADEVYVEDAVDGDEGYYMKMMVNDDDVWFLVN